MLIIQPASASGPHPGVALRSIVSIPSMINDLNLNRREEIYLQATRIYYKRGNGLFIVQLYFRIDIVLKLIRKRSEHIYPEDNIQQR